MSTKQNKVARALKKKTGMSHQAALNAQPQCIKPFHTSSGNTFSARCKSCRRWILCGEDERNGVCFCAQPYRIVFGNEDWTRVSGGSLLMGPRCMDCGTEFRLTQPHEGRNPWHAVNHGQSQCNHCFTLGKAEFAKDAILPGFADFAKKDKPLAAAVVSVTKDKPLAAAVVGVTKDKLLAAAVTSANLDKALGVVASANLDKALGALGDRAEERPGSFAADEDSRLQHGPRLAT